MKAIQKSSKILFVNSNRQRDALYNEAVIIGKVDNESRANAFQNLERNS